MYQGTKKKISNKAYAVVKRHWKGKFNRTQYRRDMKKFKISSRDADVLRTDFYNDKLDPLFRQHWTANLDLQIFCCRIETGDVSYKPDPKHFKFQSFGREVTKPEYRDFLEDVLIPKIRDIEGDIKCKDLSESQLEVCKKVNISNLKIGSKQIPKKKKGKK